MHYVCYVSRCLLRVIHAARGLTLETALLSDLGLTYRASDCKNLQNNYTKVFMGLNKLRSRQAEELKANPDLLLAKLNASAPSKKKKDKKNKKNKKLKSKKSAKKEVRFNDNQHVR